MIDTSAAPDAANGEEQKAEGQPAIEDPLAKDLWAFASKKMT